MLMITMGIFSLDSIGIIPIAIGLISLVIFVKTERGKENQIFNLDIFKNIEVDIGSFAAVSSNYITYVITHIITLYLLYVKDVSPHIGGMILLVTPVTMIVISPISGRLTNRFDSRLLCALALILLVITLAMMTVLEELPFALLIAAMVLQGMGHALFSPANTKNVLTTVDDEDVANASAFLSTSKDFGKSISIGTFNVICAFVGLNFDKISEVNKQLLVASDIAISIAIIPAVISIILLIYSKYKFAERVNIEPLRLVEAGDS